MVVSENKKSKINYFDTYFQANKSNMKNLWTGIKSIINKKSKNSLQSISQLTTDGEAIQDPQKMANVSVFLPRTKKSPLDYLKNRNMNCFFISPVTYSEIEDIIISLRGDIVLITQMFDHA